MEDVEHDRQLHLVALGQLCEDGRPHAVAGGVRTAAGHRLLPRVLPVAAWWLPRERRRAAIRAPPHTSHISPLAHRSICVQSPHTGRLDVTWNPLQFITIQRHMIPVKLV